MQLEKREPGRGHQMAALVASERARARGLLDLLHKARPKITAGVDRQLLSREQPLRADVEHADERLTRLLSARPRPDEVKSAERELDERLGGLRDVQRQLQVQSPRYASLTQPSPLDVPGIQRSSLFNPRVHAFLVQGDLAVAEARPRFDVVTGRPHQTGGREGRA